MTYLNLSDDERSLILCALDFYKTAARQGIGSEPVIARVHALSERIERIESPPATTAQSRRRNVQIDVACLHLHVDCGCRPREAQEP